MSQNRIPYYKGQAAVLLCTLIIAVQCYGMTAFAGKQVQCQPADQFSIRYKAARDYAYRLERDPAIGKKRQSWLTGTRNFRQIYLSDAKGPLAANCLYMMARMYRRMYQRFYLPHDLDEAIAYYNDVSSLFPQHKLADDSLFAIGEIYRIDKKKPRQAAKSYIKQIRRFPKGDKYMQAVNRLRELAEKYSLNLPEHLDLSGTKHHFVNVLPVKYWSSDDYTRVVIRSSAPVHYTSNLLEKNGRKSRRLFVDFAQSHIDPKFTEPVPIQDGLLRQIKTGQLNTTTVRVTLDIESISNYKIFSLNDPFRVIIDVHGQGKKRGLSKTAPAIRNKRIQAEKAAQSATSPGHEQAQKETQTPSVPPVPTENKQKTSKIKVEDNQSLITLEDLKKRKPGTAAQKKPSTAEDATLSLTQQLGLGVHRIVIDPGHGGKDPGAMAYGLKEKEITLKVAKKTAADLRKKYHYEVIMTRDTDTFLPLEERTAIANTKKADLFVSIHVNAHPSKSIRGVETFYLNLATNTEAMRVAARENATTSHNISDLQDILADLMQNSKIEESSKLAEFVQNSLVSGLKERHFTTQDLGVKQAPFYVLIGAEMPAVLAEISFISNHEEADMLRQDQYLNEIADRIASGIAGYVDHQATAALRLN